MTDDVVKVVTDVTVDFDVVAGVALDHVISCDDVVAVGDCVVVNVIVVDGFSVVCCCVLCQ